MRIYGYCMTCHRMRPVRCGPIGMTGHPPVGECDACIDKREKRRKEQHARRANT